MSRILLALQYWEGDRARAGELARFIADLEAEPRTDADLLLSARFDSGHDPEVVAHVSKKFRTFTARGRSTLTGYPDGSFGLWHDTVTSVRDRCKSGEWPTYDCVLTFEADCTPMCRDWVPRLLEAWKAGTADRDRIALGQLWPAPGCPYPHINGNLLVSGGMDHLDRLVAWRAKPKLAWDVGIYPMLRDHGAVGTPAISSFYVRHAADRWFDYTTGRGAVFFHGDKDGSAQAFARHKLVGSPRPVASPGGLLSAGGAGIDGASIVPPGPDGVWRYDDAVPSVFEQGFSGRIQRFPDDAFRRFNPGLAADRRGGFFMASRALDRRSDECTIRVARLSGPPYYSVESEEPVVGLPGWADGTVSFFEDPRLFWWGERLMLAYAHVAYFPHSICNQSLVELDPGTFRVRDSVDVSWIGGNTPRPGCVEKNWQFFPDDRGRLCVVYALAPHEVYRVDARQRLFSNITPVANWRKPFGQPRGGTPPVRVGGRWFSFFHSATRHKARRRRYHAGAYSFKWDAGGAFVADGCTREPLWTGSEKDGFLWPAGSAVWEPVVVFPSGAVFDPARASWTVSVGINDCFCGLFEVPHDQLLARF